LINEDKEKMYKSMGISENRYDESGNVKNVDLAKFMVSDLARYAKETHDTKLTIKYLNPTYAIRTAPANGGDTDLCHRLAHTAVHCVQAGYTDFSIGQVRNYPVMIPLNLLIE
jgi:6-phosphofructokinase 1